MNKMLEAFFIDSTNTCWYKYSTVVVIIKDDCKADMADKTRLKYLKDQTTHIKLTETTSI